MVNQTGVTRIVFRVYAGMISVSGWESERGSVRGRVCVCACFVPALCLIREPLLASKFAIEFRYVVPKGKHWSQELKLTAKAESWSWRPKATIESYKLELNANATANVNAKPTVKTIESEAATANAEPNAKLQRSPEDRANS